MLSIGSSRRCAPCDWLRSWSEADEEAEANEGAEVESDDDEVEAGAGDEAAEVYT